MRKKIATFGKILLITTFCALIVQDLFVAYQGGYSAIRSTLFPTLFLKHLMQNTLEQPYHSIAIIPTDNGVSFQTFSRDNMFKARNACGALQDGHHLTYCVPRLILLQQLTIGGNRYMTPPLGSNVIPSPLGKNQKVSAIVGIFPLFIEEATPTIYIKLYPKTTRGHNQCKNDIAPFLQHSMLFLCRETTQYFYDIDNNRILP